jgi:hypothetical protein
VRTVTVIRDERARPALLRAQPSIRALVTGEIPAGTVLEVLGEERGDAVSPGNNLWYRVRWNDQVGYVYAPLVS